MPAIPNPHLTFGAPRRTARAVAAAGALSICAAPARSAELATPEIPTMTLAARELKAAQSAQGDNLLSVNERAYSVPNGVRFGNFIFFPSTGALVRYDDNILSTHANRKKDIVTELTPNLVIRSDTGNHELNVALGGKFAAYAEYDDQNYAEYTARVQGALHFDHAHTLSASAMSMLQHENGFDPGFPQASVKPVEFLRHSASLGITRDAGQLYGTFSTSITSWEYKDAVAADGSRIDQSYRNSEMLKAQVSGGYRFSPGYSLLARAAMIRIWNEGTPEQSLDSLGYEAYVGIRGEISPVLRWELVGGWGTRNFDQTGLATVNSGLFEAQLTWLVTQRLTLHGIVGRSLSDTVDASGTARVDTRAAVRADAELLHNLVLHLNAEVRESDYSSLNTSTRTLMAGIGLDYHFSENWLFTISYDYQHRQSSQLDDDVTRNRFSIGAKLRF